MRLKRGEMALVQSLCDLGHRSACLVLCSGAEPGQRHALPEGTLNPGRAPDCQVPLDNAAFSCRHQPPSTAVISRRHAELQVQRDKVRLRGLDLANGSFVNEQRLRGPVLLKDGDMLRPGEMVLEFFSVKASMPCCTTASPRWTPALRSSHAARRWTR